MGKEKSEPIYLSDEEFAKLPTEGGAPPGPGRREWPDPSQAAARPKTDWKKDGIGSVLLDEILHGHAPNAVEPTTGAQIVAPAMMAGAIPATARLMSAGVGAAKTALGMERQAAPMATELGEGAIATEGAANTAKHGSAMGALARRLLKAGAVAVGGHEALKFMGH